MVLALTRTALACIALCAMPLATAMELIDYSCSKRNTLAGLQRLIDTELSGGAHVNLRGQCSGRLVLRKDITISGDGRTHLQRSQPGILIHVDHARVTLINLTLSSRDTAVHCQRGASCLLRDVVVRAQSGQCIRISDGAHLELTGAQLRGGSNAALMLTNNASARLSGNLAVSGEHQPGLALAGWSSLDAADGSLTIGNGAVVDSSWLQLDNASIEGGLTLRGNAQANLGSGVEVDRVHCAAASGLTSSTTLSCPDGTADPQPDDTSLKPASN
jgi:hypothetical protein